jgi:hypothetical protein
LVYAHVTVWADNRQGPTGQVSRIPVHGFSSRCPVGRTTALVSIHEVGLLVAS